MRFHPQDPPREFDAGPADARVTLRDCGRLELGVGEQVTFVTPAGAEYDVVSTDFGFYATPSLNSRLPRFGLRGVLVRNRQDHFFVLLVERSREAAFDDYARRQQLRIVAWLDDTRTLRSLHGHLEAVGHDAG